MEKHNVKQELILPVAVLFTAMLASFIIYNISRYINNNNVHLALAFLFGTTYFLSVACGTFFIYSVAYLKGASLKIRVIAISIVPFIWATKECIRLYESHSVLECLYYYLNPLNIWLASFVILEAGLADVFCRYLMKRNGKDIRIAGPGTLITIFTSLLFAISAYSWGKGENFYVFFLAGYRALFGSGL